MDDTKNNWSAYLGKNIENLRRAKEISQQDLANFSKVPRSTIANIESGSSNPSLGNLIPIAKALQISIDELISPPFSDTVLVKAKDLPYRIKGGGDVKIFNMLLDTTPGIHLERFELEAGAHFKGNPHLRGTKEYFSCFTGTFTIYVNGEKFTLHSGDVLKFAGDQGHSYANSGQNKAIGFSVVLIA